MLSFRFRNKDLNMVNKLNFNMNLALVGERSFIDNEVVVSPVRQDPNTGKYEFIVIIGDESNTNIALDIKGMEICTYTKD